MKMVEEIKEKLRNGGGKLLLYQIFVSALLLAITVLVSILVVGISGFLDSYAADKSRAEIERRVLHDKIDGVNDKLFEIKWKVEGLEDDIKEYHEENEKK